MQDLRLYTQAQAETRYHIFDYTSDLISGAVLISAAATLTRPDGSTASPTATIDAGTNTVYVQVTGAMLTAIGVYHLACNATVDNLGALANETLNGVRTIHVPY